MAFEHAYVVYGQQGTLAEMQRLGFETFSHAIDEGYDTESDEQVRLDMIHTVVKDVIADKTIFTDSETQRILVHNKKHFYNPSIVKQLFVEQLVDPLMEFIES